jgi:ectoine hydroxylase-related dioxygenase (phytanoyl-CoA dioxygenase family)
MDTVFADLAERGYAVIADALSPIEVDALSAAADTLPPLTRDEQRAGVRDLFTRLPAVQQLAEHPAIAGWPAAILGAQAFAVRALFFDKTSETNWKVTWHQDLTIPTQVRCEVPGFGPWSVKAGITHVQPPASVLERMLTVRIHLDPCGLENGPLRVLPGTHRLGKVAGARINEMRTTIPEVSVAVPRGGLLLMRPLLLHASSPARSPTHRRVIHLEYAATELPAGLAWRERWAPPRSGTRASLARLGRRLVPT